MDAAGALGLGNALHAVGAALPLEDGVGALALDRERDLLVAAAVRWARRELLDLEAAPFGVAREHPVDVAGPERGLVAADALANLHDRVLVVVGIAGDERLAQRRFDIGEARLELGNELAEIAVLARFVEVRAQLEPLPCEPVRLFELLQLPPGLRRFAMVVVDGRVRHPLLRVRVGALELVDEFFDSGHAGD